MAYDALGLHVEAARDHRQSLAFEPRNPGCLAAFRGCLAQLLASPNTPDEEKDRARLHLEQLDATGRISEESLRDALESSAAAAAAGAAGDSSMPLNMSTEGPTAAGDKKKRTAGGF